MSKFYTKEFLISELHRFVKENGKNPTARDMTVENGYLSTYSFYKYFKTFNEALIESGLKINTYKPKLNGSEICSCCGKKADEISNFIQWFYNKNDNYTRYCNKCGNTKGIFDYKKSELNPKSTTGKATVSQRIVAKTLGLELKNDCNCSISFTYPYDLYDKGRYNYINVKDSKLHNSININHNSHWYFGFKNKKIPDTYIMLGFDENRKNILHVWITDAIDDLVFNKKTGKLLTGKNITNTPYDLNKIQSWEVNAKPYDDMLHLMSEKRKETNGEECFLSNYNL